ncbi:MAG: GNAT family N-acetyltransferase [Burkholderiaceae bacterium]
MSSAALLRQATRDDLPGIWRVRYAVRENTLAPGRIGDGEVIAQIEDTGRGWVVEEGGEIVAFAIGDARDGNVWALFVDPRAQGRGHGSRLHDEMVAWLWSRGLERLWLGTGNGTRACAFYEKHGWRAAGPHGERETRYELDRPGAA